MQDVWFPTVEDSWLKGNYRCYKLSGSGLIGFNFGPGLGIPFMENALKRNCLQFMCCKNYRKCGPGVICAYWKQPFDNIPSGTNFYATLILIDGIRESESGDAIELLYYKWRGPSGFHSSSGLKRRCTTHLGWFL